MDDDTAWYRFRQDAVLEGGGKTEYRKDGLETQAQHGVSGGDSTHRVGQKRPTSFSKFFDLGANWAMGTDLFCVNTQILMLLLRDSGYAGRYYGSTLVIARELGKDMRDIRKRIKAMEDRGMLYRMETKSGSSFIQMNPHYFVAGGQEDEDIAKSIWARETSRRIKEADKARKRGP